MSRIFDYRQPLSGVCYLTAELSHCCMLTCSAGCLMCLSKNSQPAALERILPEWWGRMMWHSGNEIRTEQCFPRDMCVQWTADGINISVQYMFCHATKTKLGQWMKQQGKSFVPNGFLVEIINQMWCNVIMEWYKRQQVGWKLKGQSNIRVQFFKPEEPHKP